MIKKLVCSITLISFLATNMTFAEPDRDTQALHLVQETRKDIRKTFINDISKIASVVIVAGVGLLYFTIKK